MPLYGRIIVCSALATVLLYTIYRKRRRRSPEVLTEECSPGDYCYQFDLSTASEIISWDENFEELLEFHSCRYLDQPKVVLCPSYPVPKVLSTRPTIIEAVLPSEVTMDYGSSYPQPEADIVPTSVDIVRRSPNSSDSGSVQAHTPESNHSAFSPEPPSRTNLPPGCFDDPSNDVYEDNPEEMNGTIIPKVLIPSDLWAEGVDQDIWHETFCVPAHMGGVLIGRLGKNVRQLKSIWQADFSLNNCPGRQDTLIFKLSCPIKFKDEVLQWVSRRLRMRPSKTPIGNPNQLKRSLPLGEMVPVYIRSLYAAKEFFVTIKDSEFSNYVRLQADMDQDYSGSSSFRMQLCEPVTSGTVAIVPHDQGFARAVIISVYSTWPKTAFYFLLDHGTFGVAPLNNLKKIRAKYMRTPFQAIHVTWAHAFPIFSDIPDLHILRTFFSNNRIQVFATRMETCCRASVTFNEPYPPPYSSHGFMDLLVNACNSGLYMAVPLVIYPNRQSWLNQTDIPYYPCNYSAIDYSALISFVPDGDQSSPIDGATPEIDANCEQSEAFKVTNTHPSNRPRTGRGGFGSRKQMASQPPKIGRGGISQKPPTPTQKENESDVSKPEGKNVTFALEKTLPHEQNDTEIPEPKRRPLGVRNARGGGTGSHRGSSVRGRGNVK